jgi:hypothetical protein
VHRTRVSRHTCTLIIALFAIAGALPAGASAEPATGWWYSPYSVAGVRGSTDLVFYDPDASTVEFQAYYAEDPTDPSTAGWHFLGWGAQDEYDQWKLTWDTTGIPDQAMEDPVELIAWPYYADTAADEPVYTSVDIRNEWAAEQIDRSPDSTIESGDTIQAWFDVKNIGVYAWSRNNVFLALTESHDRDSPFRAESWFAPRRPATLDRAEVQPGETTHMSFALKAPAVDEPQEFVEWYEPVAEGTAWLHSPVWDGAIVYTVLPARAPEVRFVAAPGRLTSGAPADFRIEATDNFAVRDLTVAIGDRRTTATATGDGKTYTATLPTSGLPDGVQRATATATDVGGRTGTSTFDIELSTPRPPLPPVVVRPPRVPLFNVAWGMPREGRPRIRWARVTSVLPRSRVDVRCIARCPRPYSSAQRARAGARCRIGRQRVRRCVTLPGFPYRVRQKTRFRVIVSRSDRTAVAKVYVFRGRAVTPVSERCVEPRSAAVLPCP